jgi:hypothetical protein
VGVRGHLPSLLQAAANARKRLRRRAEEHRTRGTRASSRDSPPDRAPIWPWLDGSGRFLPQGDALTPEMAGACFFALLAHAASERRNRGGPSGGLSPALAEAGFGSAEWLPDRTDDLAIRLLTAPPLVGVPHGEVLEAASVLVRSTLSNSEAVDVSSALHRLGIDLGVEDAGAMLGRARVRLPALARWLEENARELLERT